MSQSPPTCQVCVRIEARPVTSRWVSHEWAVTGILPADAVASGAQGPFEVSLHRDEAEGYYLNVSSGAPKAFVMWRADEDDAGGTPMVKFVTLSYNEAARLLDAQEKVDAIDLPSEMLAWLIDYVEANYRPEPKKRRAKVSFLSPQEREKL